MARKWLIGLITFLSVSAFASDVPGGMVRDASQLKANTYEMVLSPAYLMDPPAAYLSSEIRYQPNEDLGVGFGFGAGEVGFNFGVNGTWYVTPRSEGDVSLSVLGGVYFNRLSPSNYFVFRVAPVVSQSFGYAWGTVTPYAGAQLSPSFALTQYVSNKVSLRTVLGAQFALKDMGGMRLWTEAGIGLFASNHEIALGISYPFTAL